MTKFLTFHEGGYDKGFYGNNEIEKVDNTFDAKFEKLERHLTTSHNELRKLIENKIQTTNHSLDKTNNTGNE